MALRQINQNGQKISIEGEQNNSSTFNINGNCNQISIGCSNCIVQIRGNGNIINVIHSTLKLFVNGNGNLSSFIQCALKIKVNGNGNQFKSQEQLQPIEIYNNKGFGNQFPKNSIQKDPNQNSNNQAKSNSKNSAFNNLFGSSNSKLKQKQNVGFDYSNSNPFNMLNQRNSFNSNNMYGGDGYSNRNSNPYTQSKQSIKNSYSLSSESMDIEQQDDNNNYQAKIEEKKKFARQRQYQQRRREKQQQHRNRDQQRKLRQHQRKMQQQKRRLIRDQQRRAQQQQRKFQQQQRKIIEHQRRQYQQQRRNNQQIKPRSNSIQEVFGVQNGRNYINKRQVIKQQKQLPDNGLNEVQLNRLHSHRHQGPQLESHNDQETYLNCFHSYHTYCIQTWLAKSSKCPICNENVRKCFEY